MTLEDAKYYEVLLGVGEFNEFQKFIDSVMRCNDEIDESTIDLLFVGNDYNKCCDILTELTRNKKINEIEVAYKLICYVKDKLNRKEICKNQAIILFSKFSKEANKFHEDVLQEPWVTMKLLSMILEEKNSIIYDDDFYNFINKGKILTDNEAVQSEFFKLFGQNNQN